MDIARKIGQAICNNDNKHLLLLSTMDAISFRNLVKSIGRRYVYVDFPKQKYSLYHFAHELYVNIPELTELVSCAHEMTLNACRHDDISALAETFLHAVLEALDKLGPFVIQINPIENIIEQTELLSLFRTLVINGRYPNLKFVVIASDEKVSIKEDMRDIFKQENFIGKEMEVNNEAWTNNKKVYISYSWKEPSNHIVMNNLVPAFISNNIEFALDKNDCNYLDNIPEFEERIGRGEFIVAVISDAYVHSIQCMYEVACIFENGNVRERLRPLCFDDVKRNDNDYYKDIVNYWGNKMSETRVNIAQIGDPADRLLGTELKYLEKICRYIDVFFKYLRSTNTCSLTEMGKNQFEKLIEIIGGEGKKAEFKKKTITLNMTISPNIPTIIVNGGSPQINMNTSDGDMIITNENCF